jgi:hypothetical protein
MRGFAVAATLLVGAVVPAQAVAASTKLPPGVHVDPGSPAGKEYSIPITVARSQAAATQPTGPGQQNPPAFGAGVTPSSTGGASAPSSGGSGHASGQRPATSGSRETRPRSRHRNRPILTASSYQQSAVGSGGAGGNAWLALAGGGGLVLVLGAAGGLALRRRR